MSTYALGIAIKTPIDSKRSRDARAPMNKDIYKTDRAVYTPSDFLQWREGKTLELTPKFQRREVWKSPAKSYFIDTILREMPIPPIYMRLVSPEDGSLKPIRQVVDGQQRLRAVLDFIDEKFRLSDELSATWKGQWFSDLKTAEQQRIFKSAFPGHSCDGDFTENPVTSPEFQVSMCQTITSLLESAEKLAVAKFLVVHWNTVCVQASKDI